MIRGDLKILFNETGTELYTYYTTLYWGGKLGKSSLHMHKNISRRIHIKLIILVLHRVAGLETRQMTALWEEEFSPYTFYIFK